MNKIISILGSTGSIGLNSLKIIEKEKNFKIYLLAANKNIKLIIQQIKKYKPNVFVINNNRILEKVKKKFKHNKVKLINDINNFNKLKKSDITIAAIPGIAGLQPTIALTKKSRKMIIANKESVICGWNLIQKCARTYNTKIIPVDSEHFSIMNLLENENVNNVRKVYLTASGGPFLNYKIPKLKNVKPNQATKHPKWKMGKKISVDSATLMNKMLELVEAQKLFSLNKKKIEIIIHPECLVHAIVEFNNGICKLIYHDTTMIIPLANAILGKNFKTENYFKTKKSNKNPIILKNFEFKKVDKKRFPIIKLKKRLNEYNSSPIIINAVNEILVDQYLKKKIGFTSFYNCFLKVLNDRNYKKYAIKEPKNIGEIMKIDLWSRQKIKEKLKL